jgi:hypothetical protein
MTRLAAAAATKSTRTPKPAGETPVAGSLPLSEETLTLPDSETMVYSIYDATPVKRADRLKVAIKVFERSDIAAAARAVALTPYLLEVLARKVGEDGNKKLSEIFCELKEAIEAMDAYDIWAAMIENGDLIPDVRQFISDWYRRCDAASGRDVSYE